jgi:Tfp pilus assembly protein PilP
MSQAYHVETIKTIGTLFRGKGSRAFISYCGDNLNHARVDVVW